MTDFGVLWEGENWFRYEFFDDFLYFSYSRYDKISGVSGGFVKGHHKNGSEINICRVSNCIEFTKFIKTIVIPCLTKSSEINKLKAENEQLKLQLEYHPDGGKGYLASKTDFEQRISELPK
jgi:hypothetical protein